MEEVFFKNKNFDNNEERFSYYFDIDSNGFESALEEFGQILSTAPNYYERKNYAIVDDLKKIYQNEEEEMNQNIFLDYLLSVRSHNYDFTFGNGNTGIFKNSQKIQEELPFLRQRRKHHRFQGKEYLQRMYCST